MALNTIKQTKPEFIHSNEMMMAVYSDSSFKLQSAGRHVASLVQGILVDWGSKPGSTTLEASMIMFASPMWLINY